MQQTIERLRIVNAIVYAPDYPFAGISRRQLYRMLVTTPGPLRTEVRKAISLLSERDELRATLDRVTTALDIVIIAESGMVPTEGTMDNIVRVQNVSEDTGAPVNDTDAGYSVASQQGQNGLMEVEDFLSRPIEVYAGALTMGSNADLVFPIWEDYFNQPSVRAKLRNYAFIRANLKLRISVTGTPFHYGRLLVSYQPLAQYNQNLISYSGIMGPYPLMRGGLLSYLSQAPGAILIDVTENKPVEILCPFISTKPMHRLYGVGAAVVGAGSLSDSASAGDLYVYSMAPPGAITVGASNPYIQIYAWLEDVQLGCITGTNMVITTESGSMDERKVGPVERVASRAYDIASSMQKMGFTGPYVVASKILAGAVGKVAAIFGWSRPIIDANIKYVRPLPFANTALTIGSETTMRVVLDPKQELSVDGTIVGSDGDDMQLDRIYGRKTYFHSFEWETTSPIMASPIFEVGVNPNVVWNYESLLKRWIQPTALAHASIPFSFWRGDITYTFDVICSSFHRGKILLYYEPNIAQSVIIDSDIALNKQHIAVIDLQDTNTFSVCIEWASHRPWLRVVAGSQSWRLVDNFMSLAEQYKYCNGYLGVTPFTALSSPDGSSCTVNVYVHSEGITYNGLTDANFPDEREVYTESGYLTMADDHTCITLNPSSATTNTICQDYFGEQPLSFRSLMKRYVTNSTVNYATATGPANSVVVLDRIMPRNQCPYGTTTPVLDLFSYNYYAYLGVRGSVRRKLYTNMNTVYTATTPMMVLLDNPSSTFATQSASIQAVLPTSTLSGTTTFIPLTNGGIDFELPYYSNNLFQVSFSDTLCEDTVNDCMEATWYRNYTVMYPIATATAAATGYVTLDAAAGEDFSFMRYQGAPFYSQSPLL